MVLRKFKEESMQRIELIDLFCGIGGLTHGLQKSGICVLAGLDNDPNCGFPYKKNNPVKFIEADISSFDFRKMANLYSQDSVKVLAGCAPCQPFSSLTHGIKVKCEKWSLLNHFFRAVKILHPHIISVENVAGIAETDIFKDFISQLREEGYVVNRKIVNCADYGIPQMRKRMILLASAFGKIEMPQKTNSKAEYLTVRKVIGKLPRIKAGQQCRKDTLHRARNLSDLNLKRIRQSRPGGTWREWKKDLLPECYKKESGKGYGSVYGRMEWDKPSPTITTQFSTYGCGRFGHPVQDRALSVREAAMLQTFPKSYILDSSLNMDILGRQIGNAVPPRLGKIIGETIQHHVKKIR